MQAAATIILAILATISVGALIVGGVLWLSRRSEEAAQDRRRATALAWSETAADDTHH